MQITVPVPDLPSWLWATLAYLIASYAGAWAYYKLPTTVRKQLYYIFGSPMTKDPAAQDPAVALSPGFAAASAKANIVLAPVIAAMLLRNLLVNLSNSSKQVIVAGFWLIAGYIGLKTVLTGTDYLARLVEAFR